MKPIYIVTFNTVDGPITERFNYYLQIPIYLIFKIGLSNVIMYKMHKIMEVNNESSTNK